MAADHVAALAVTAALGAALPIVARAQPGARTRLFASLFGAVLLAWFVAYHVVVLIQGDYELDFDLPLHLTDAVTLVAALALMTRRPLLFELTWFWGLTASLQAILTPDLGADDRFPTFFYWHYFVTHGGVVVAAVFLAFGLGLTARPGAVLRVFLATAAWAGVAALVPTRRATADRVTLGRAGIGRSVAGLVRVAGRGWAAGRGGATHLPIWV